MSMSKWTHVMCGFCWRTLNPHMEPTTIPNHMEVLCCSCGFGTQDGIYVIYDPEHINCMGTEGIHREDTDG